MISDTFVRRVQVGLRAISFESVRTEASPQITYLAWK